VIRTLRTRVQSRRLLAAAPALLLAALLPSLLYIDHWGTYLFGMSAALEEAETAGHEQHCHSGVSTCSSQPATGAPVLGSIVEMPRPRLTTTALEEAQVMVQGLAVAPPTEPPRS
jgi:hypothetical protein